MEIYQATSSAIQKLTWDAVGKMFETRCRAQNISASMMENYRWALHSWKTFHATKLTPAEIMPQDIRAWLETLREQGLASETVATYFTRMRTIIGFLHQEGFIVLDPFQRITKPRVERRLIRPWTVDEFKAVLGLLDDKSPFGARDRAILLLLADSGARLSEALGLLVGDLDLVGCSALVMGKGRKERMVAFGNATRAAISTWLMRRGSCSPEDVLFCDRFGKLFRRNAFQHHLKRLTIRAKIADKRLSAHGLRHLYASQALQKGMDLGSLQAVLGHVSPTMSLRYAKQTLGDALNKARTVAVVDHMGPLPLERKRVKLK